MAHAIAEQVNGVSEINTAVSQVDKNTQRQAASFEEVTAASKLLSNEADGLKQSTAHFNTGNKVVPARSRRKATAPEKTPKQRAVLPAAGNLAEDASGWDEF